MSGPSGLPTFLTGLKNKDEEIRINTARELKRYVTSELREMVPDDVSAFMDKLNHHIYELTNSSDSNDRRGGIIAIVSLCGAEVSLLHKSRYFNFLSKLIPCNDVAVMEMAVKAVGLLTVASGTYSGILESLQVKSLEWIGHDNSDNYKHAATLVFREIADSTPSLFYQRIQEFFDEIFKIIRYSKPVIRDLAVQCLHAALQLAAQRETREGNPPVYYKQCFYEAMNGFDDHYVRERRGTRDDWVHGSLLVLNELMRISNHSAEALLKEIEDITEQQSDHDRALKEAAGRGRQRRVALQQKHALITSLAAPASPGTGAASSKPLAPVRHADSNTCRQLLLENFSTVCSTVLKQRGNKQAHVQISLLLLLARLANYHPEGFRDFVNHALNHVLAQVKQLPLRPIALQVLGLLAVSQPGMFAVHWSRCLEPLPFSSKDTQTKRRAVEAEALICVALFAKAIAANAASAQPSQNSKEQLNRMKELVDPMLATGLSPALTASLRIMMEELPSLSKSIQDGLLNMLGLLLMGKQLQPVSSQRANLQPQQLSSGVEAQDMTTVTLALRTLSSFNFEGQSLTNFLRHCADQFLCSELRDIRLEAVQTCCSLLAPSLALISMKCGPKSSTAQSTVTDVLNKLLTVAITDPDADIRKCVFASLDERFDSQLAQADCLNSLFIAMKDEVFEIREIALCTIGRLSARNPAYVMPYLRKVLIQLLTELEHSGLTRNMEEASRMLGHLVANAPRLIRPFNEPILKVLIPKLTESDTTSSVVISILIAIGEQAQVSGTEMRPWSKKLLEILIELLQDTSSLQKREVALWTLGQVIECTGNVVKPYNQFPQLLDSLLGFLRTEQSHNIRSETIRVLGCLGALDPYKHRINLGEIAGSETAALSESNNKPADDQDEIRDCELLVQTISSGSGSLDDFYPGICIALLMKLLRDTSLAQHHDNVVSALAFIFRWLRHKCSQYLHQVIPAYISLIRGSTSRVKEYLFIQLGLIISFVKLHIRKYLDDIFALITEMWSLNSPLQNTLVALVEQLVMALGPEFKKHLPEIIPQILRVFTHDNSTDRAVTDRLLLALQHFGATLDDYLHLILPGIVKIFDSTNIRLSVRRTALETLEQMTDTLCLSEFASRILHPLARVLQRTPELREPAMSLLTALAAQMGPQYQIFIPMMNRVLVANNISYQAYDLVLCKVVQASELGDDVDTTHRPRAPPQEPNIEDPDFAPTRKHYVNPANLQKAWSVEHCSSREDWTEWLRRLTIIMLKESPSYSIKACAQMAELYKPLARDLFNSGFVSVWIELTEEQQDSLCAALESALEHSHDVPEITQTILNLAEFMEHCPKGSLPLQPVMLSRMALQCRAYAKALHYQEMEFQKGTGTQKDTLEKLISIYNKLQQPEAASGVLKYTRQLKGDVQVEERWYEELRDWQSASRGYQQKLESAGTDSELLAGRMRCLESLGEWDELLSTAADKFHVMNHSTQQQVAKLCANAAWGLGRWDDMKRYALQIPSDTHDSCFCNAAMNIHHDQFGQAQLYIDKARDLLDTELASLAGESYNRAYPVLFSVQLLSELEEVIQYKLVPERRPVITQMWSDRLLGCESELENWRRALQVHSLVLKPGQDAKTWLKFASLARRKGQSGISLKILNRLLNVSSNKDIKESLYSANPMVSIAYMKHLWHDTKRGRKKDAYELLAWYINNKIQPQLISHVPETEINSRLTAKCFLLRGRWLVKLDELKESTIKEVLSYHVAATELDSDWYKAWHHWSYVNYEAVLYYKHQPPEVAPGAAGDGAEVEARRQLNEHKMVQHCVRAVHGFFRSISLSSGTRSLQDTLRLLTLWFDYGQFQEVYDALDEGVRTTDINNWLQVIPQLIARLDTKKQLVGKLINQLLSDVGRAHPQALVYPLTVASKSKISARQNSANQILKSMREHSEKLVQQAQLVSEELIRVAILWPELWYEGLEEASRLYFGEHNVKAMLNTLQPLHAMMQRGPTTMKETSFAHTFGRDLAEAQEWCRKYNRSNNVRDLNQAWDLYFQVFRKITKQLNQHTVLELQHVSPNLLHARDMELAVPGTYDPSQPLVRIHRVRSSLQVITSKQRPRKLSIFGSNGSEFQFLLKGHEDLRQDERVMQLFRLVNSLLLNNPTTYRSNLAITRYSVIPLSTNSGLIGWVPNCDTLHSLIKDFRERKKILLNIEHRIMLRMAPDYDHLMLQQKVEVFEHALELTPGDDLAQILWFKSPSAEIWFERRTNYTRSLAVMSMVGYILGLGDRHPSNLMIDRFSGKAIHIDFGDCFEVAMTREKFPEKIPFRLTRMLMKAMEVTGIDGIYRQTCENVLTVLRDHRDSLMAVLEAFVYDPLLNWRLVHRKKRSGVTAAGAVGGEPSPDIDQHSTGVLRRSSNNGEGTGEEENKRAVEVVNRVRDKLTGNDFGTGEVDIPRQVQLLIEQATTNENLCQCYIGWCPFW